LQRTLHDSSVAAAAAAAKAKLSAAAAGKKAGGGKDGKAAGGSKGGSKGGHEREASSAGAPPGEEPATVALRKMIGRCLDTVVDSDQVDIAPEDYDDDSDDGGGGEEEEEEEEGKFGEAGGGGGGGGSKRRKRVAGGRELGRYAQQVREQRFRVHNREWLEAVNADLAAEHDGRAEEAAFLEAQRHRAAMGHGGHGHGDHRGDEDDSLGSEFDSEEEDGDSGAAGDWDYGMRGGRHGNVEMDMGMLDDGEDEEDDDGGGHGGHGGGLGDSMDGVPGQWDTHGYGGEAGADGDFNQVRGRGRGCGRWGDSLMPTCRRLQTADPPLLPPSLCSFLSLPVLPGARS
jgi:hypothetical protein